MGRTTRLDRDDVERLREIRDEIGDLMAEAADLLRVAPEIARRADLYCLSQIGRALGDDETDGGFDPAGASLDAIIEACEEEVGAAEAETDDPAPARAEKAEA